MSPSKLAAFAQGELSSSQRGAMRTAACVLGADGYLGQFVARELARAGAFDAVLACGRKDTEQSYPELPSLRRTRPCDFASTSSCDDLAKATAGVNAPEVLRVVVNCAAMSAPGACEKSPEAARLANAPRALWLAIKREATARGEEPPLWIQLSTDHVYDGQSALSDESVTPSPVNAYGASKVFCEESLLLEYDRAIVLRSSIITGPKAPFKRVERTLFLDFIAESFEKEGKTTFYEDEFRSPICVHDICRVVVGLSVMGQPSTGQRVYNMGGPDRVNRVDMANGVAEYLARGDSELEATYKSKITSASCAEAKQLRGVAAPPDISMDSSALLRDVCRDWAPRSFRKQIEAAFESASARATSTSKKI